LNIPLVCTHTTQLVQIAVLLNMRVGCSVRQPLRVVFCCFLAPITPCWCVYQSRTMGPWLQAKLLHPMIRSSTVADQVFHWSGLSEVISISWWYCRVICTRCGCEMISICGAYTGIYWSTSYSRYVGLQLLSILTTGSPLVLNIRSHDKMAL